MNIAVVDAGNNLTAFGRMDGAWLGSIDISQNKAYTARSFDMSTKDLEPLIQPGQPLYGIEASNDGKLICFPGGIPLQRGDEVAGAIGVSGGRSSRTTRSPRPASPPSSRGESIMADNRGVAYIGPGKVEVQDIDFPELELKDGPGVNPRTSAARSPTA